ncbi:Methyltransferase type 12 and Bicoid-interacting 3 domain containing protein [Aphelenchoides fujianensis]|nr:Methyltransferase type 12 and Bicoid-interacting 3 domain containing protein [Aphelenchoides fujianensis]
MAEETKGRKMNTHEFIVMSKEEFLAPITDPQIQKIAEMPVEELMDDYNPGSTKPDGSINFECHCVSHLVASPCGHEFRRAISCQRAADEQELEQGACAEEFVEFMQCVVRTKCFKKNDDAEDEDDVAIPCQMDVPLKRPASRALDDEATTPKRKNPGQLDGRRPRRSDVYKNPLGGTPTDPLNLNENKQEKTVYNRIKKLEECHVIPGAVHNRRYSFRTSNSKKKAEIEPPPAPPPTTAQLLQSGSTAAALRKVKQEKMRERYRYGNFNYHHRVQAPFQNDVRLDLMCDDWFKDKTVLDIGCNAGLLTLSVARAFAPARILGIDIDQHLIGAARKNLRHFQDKEAKLVGRFPASFPLNLGPISAPSASTSAQFPENVWFRMENYVLETDEELEGVVEEYDVIMAWSVSKWIHLNWGDEGLKRFFKRVFRQLRPGGRFLLEPQSSRGYRKRAEAHPDLLRHFNAMQFWPDDFKDFLTSKEVGFAHCEDLDSPLIKQLGCDTPLQMYYKGPLWSNEQPTIDFELFEHSPSNQQFFALATPRGEESQQLTPQHDAHPTPPATPP